VKKVCIASSREIGSRCTEWAKSNMPDGFELGSIDNSEIFISTLYDTLIDKKFIESKERCVNFHPGILPDYRGAGAYSWSLINKEKHTGVSLHVIDHNIDSGPIIQIRKTLIYPSDTSQSLYERCMDLLFDMFKKNFNKILKGTYKTKPNNGGNIYFRKDLEDAKDISHIIKAFTFENKESAYYYNKSGKKIYIQYGE